LLERINADHVRVAPPPPPPGAMTSIDEVSDQTEIVGEPAWLPGWLYRLLIWLAIHLRGWLPIAVLALSLVIVAVLLLVSLGIVTGALAAVVIVGAVALARWLTRLNRVVTGSEAMRLSSLTAAAMHAA